MPSPPSQSLTYGVVGETSVSYVGESSYLPQVVGEGGGVEIIALVGILTTLQCLAIPVMGDR